MDTVTQAGRDALLEVFERELHLSIAEERASYAARAIGAEGRSADLEAVIATTLRNHNVTRTLVRDAARAWREAAGAA